MADFEKAMKRTARYEGGYVNDPDDAGGETYKGVSRRANPKWAGWALIDRHKQQDGKNYTRLLDKDNELQKLVEQLYRTNYWNPIRGDELTVQKIAEEIFDMAVNAGVSQAVRIAQRIVGMDETGKMDDTLLARLNGGGAR